MTYLFLLLLVALFAWAESKRDARLIREGKPIEHAGRWMTRAFVVVMASWITPAFMGPISPLVILYPWKKVALLCIASGFLFSAFFRLFLNKNRGLHPCYVSPSSRYDWFFMQLTVLRALQTRRNYLPDPGGRYRDFPHYRNRVHRAGRLAFVCELLLTLAALVVVSKL